MPKSTKNNTDSDKNLEAEVIEGEPKTPSTIVQEANIVDLSNSSMLDLSTLSPENAEQINMRAQEAKLELAKKGAEANIEIQGTKVNLDNFNDSVRDATKEGSSMTLTHTQTTSTGRTEVVMGNTEKAASGKISRSGLGLEDNTLKIVGIIAVALILIAIFAVG